MSTRADTQHIFLIGAQQSDRDHHIGGLDLPNRLLATISAHRRRRGPYTAAGTLLRAIVPTALDSRPDLVSAHEVEILTVAPELRDRVPATLETVTSLAAPDERTRFYSRLRTLRIAHGLTEFVRDLLAGAPGGPWSVCFDDLDHADPTDQEFLAVLLRRIDPGLLTVVVSGTAGLLTPPPPSVEIEPGPPASDELSTALARFCRRVAAPPADAVPQQGSGADLAARYVAGDCTSDDPALLAAYHGLPAVERQALHDQRADELTARSELSLAFGAIPYHRELGGDRFGAGVEALLSAMDGCMLLGFYDATVDFCFRGRSFSTWEEQPRLRWLFTTKLPTSLSALGRVQEAEAICDEARANTVDPAIHMQCAYATSMIYTRHKEQRDHERAVAWINEAIAIGMQLPDPKKRAFRTVFSRNGLALIEAHRNRPDKALELVTDGLAELDRVLDPDDHQLHRSVLRHNRAQVLVALRRPDEAVVDYRAVIEIDPHYPEYHFELATLLGRLGRTEEALTECETAIRLGPPFPELYYNRGDLRLGLGDLAGAVADFSYVLELDPGFVDAYVNRAGIHLSVDDVDAAERDALSGLAHQPDSPHLLAVLGRVHAERGSNIAALAAFDSALAVDADLVPALSGRAAIAYLAGDLPVAITDLARAIELSPDDPVLRYNRARVLQDLGRWADALTDLTAAADLAPEDEEVLAAQHECEAQLALI